IANPADYDQCKNQMVDTGSEKRYQCDGQQYPRKRHQGIDDDDRDESVQLASDVSSQPPNQDSSHAGKQNDRPPDPHTHTGTHQKARQDITAQLIVSKRMMPGGSRESIGKVLYSRIVGDKPWRQQGSKYQKACN